MPQRTSFYELAALLIPILMLSGYVTQRLARPRLLEPADNVRRIAVIFAFAYFPASAELLALSSVMSGEPVFLADWVVPLAVAFGVWSLAVAWVWPWLRAVWVFSPRSGRLIVLLTALAMVVGSGLVLRAGAQAQDERERLAKVLKAFAETDFSVLGSPDVFPIAMEQFDSQERDLDTRRQEHAIGRRAYLVQKKQVRMQRDLIIKATLDTIADRADLEQKEAAAQAELGLLAP